MEAFRLSFPITGGWNGQVWIFGWWPIAGAEVDNVVIEQDTPRFETVTEDSGFLVVCTGMLTLTPTWPSVSSPTVDAIP